VTSRNPIVKEYRQSRHGRGLAFPPIESHELGAYHPSRFCFEDLSKNQGTSLLRSGSEVPLRQQLAGTKLVAVKGFVERICTTTTSIFQSPKD